MKHFLIKSLTIITLLLLITSFTFTGVKTWVGGSGTGGQVTQWNRAQNWNPSGVPTASDSVVIPLTSYNPVNMNSAPGTCGALTLTGGSIYLSGNLNIVSTGGHGGHLTIGSGSTFNGSGGFTTDIDGNISRVGTFTAGTGTSTVILSGTTAQNILSSMTFNNLTITNPAGVTLGSGITVGGILTLTSGTLTTAENKVIISNNAPTAVVISAGSINGEIQRAIASGSTGTYRFTDANTLIIPNGSQSSLTVNVKSFPGTFPPYVTQGTPINRYYSVTVSGDLTATFRLAYLESELNGITETNLAMFRFVPGWANEGGIPDEANNYVELAGVSQWSLWTLGDVNDPLPIQLVSLSAEATGNSVTINWSTISEIDNLGFYVQRRTENSSYIRVSELIEGAGTSLEQRDYSWTDANVSSGQYYYRIEQVDMSGESEYSHEIVVVVTGALGVGDDGLPVAFKLGQNYPNPFNPTTNIRFEVAKTGFVTLKVYNVLGHEVATLVNTVKSPGKYDVTWDASQVPSGVYIYRLTDGTNVDIKRMMLVK